MSDIPMPDLLTWQIVDSAFPTGAFAHSGGLEAAWQHGEIDGVAGLRAFVRGALFQAGHAVVPLVNAAYRRPAAFDGLDRLADAFLTNTVANRASRVQGRALVATMARVWPQAAVLDLKARADASATHLAPVSGAAFRAVGLPLATVQHVVLWNVARGALSAAVRLGMIGSYEAQRLQLESATTVTEIATRCAGLDVEALAQTAPIIDLLQAQHDRLYSRLFQS